MDLLQSITPELKEWHAPSLTRLDVSSQTQEIFKEGSGEDLGTYAYPPAPR